MEEDRACNLEIGLGLDEGALVARVQSSKERNSKHPVQFHLFFPLHHDKEEIISSEEHSGDQPGSMAVDEEEEEEGKMINIVCDSSNSTNTSSSNSNDNNNAKNGTKKKLRLTEEQFAYLEDCFKRHSTLNLIQKQELAAQLNLEPRQVEVWFQNRRARIKQKLVERDCDFLKKCCKSLREENMKLRNELQELRTKRLQPSHFYVQVPGGTMCPYCETKNTQVLN